MRSPELLWPDARAAVRDAAASDPAAAATATPMPWDRHLRAAALASVAMAVPEHVVTNATVAEGAGVTEQWIVHRTGVHERRHVLEGERLQDLATAAGRARARRRPDVAAEDSTSCWSRRVAADELLPNAAPLVAHDLGATRAGAMDVGAACTGFLSALSLAAAQVEGGRCEQRARDRRRRAQPLHRPVRPRHRRPVRRRRRRGGRGARRRRRRPASATSSCTATASGAESIRATHEEQIIRMQGHDTFKAAVQPHVRVDRSRPSSARASASTRSTCSSTTRPTRASSPPSASGSASTTERVIDCIDRYGNTSSATLPIALADARERGMLEPGMNVLLAAFGAGFTWGAGVIEWAA